MVIKWFQTEEVISKNFKCGHCNSDISTNKGYIGNGVGGGSSHTIYICHKCSKPTYIDNYDNQYPGQKIGGKINHIPQPEVENLFEEAKDCFSISAYTACVMCTRKLLMNLAASLGAEEGNSFVSYVNFLESENYIPPNGRSWVDSIRKLGNEANHHIAPKTKKEAKLILVFAEMLLKFIFELPKMLEENS